MHQYKLVAKKGEGTFSEVIKAQSMKTGQYVAIKCMKSQFNSLDQVELFINNFLLISFQADQVNKLREIQALKKLQSHEHIIKLLEVLYDEPTGRLALVFELMDCNLYEHIKGRKTQLKPDKIRIYMFQLLKALDHMHSNGIFHRDIKPKRENILLSNDHLKLADLGSCKGVYSKHPYTEYISTRWYRPPECLMTDGYYDHKMDMWGAGCVMFEITTLHPLFPGNNELDQVHRIHNILGTPSPRILEKFRKHASHMDINFMQKAGTGLDNLLQNCSKDQVDLIKMMLTYDSDERISAKQALRHSYFKDLREVEQQKLLETSLQSIKLTRKQEDESINHDSSQVEDGRNDSLATLMKKSQYSQSFKQFQSPTKQLPYLNNKQNNDYGDKIQLPNITGKKKQQQDPKKVYGMMTKTNLYPKQKKSFIITQADYVLYGKKANLQNFGNTQRLRD